MSDMPAIDKMRVGLLLPIKTIAKVDHIAQQSSFSRNEVINVLLDRATANVSLTEEELDAVNQKIKENANARRNHKG
jgi:hypothetical protein